MSQLQKIGKVGKDLLKLKHLYSMEMLKSLKNIQKDYLMIIEKFIYGQNSTYLKEN